MDEPAKPPPPNPVAEILGDDPKMDDVDCDDEDGPGMEGALPKVGTAGGGVDPKPPPAPKPEEPKPPPKPDMANVTL